MAVRYILLVLSWIISAPVMPNDISALSDARLLAKSERARKLKYQLVVTIACHVVWGFTRFISDLTKIGVVHPHILAVTLGCLGHYAARLIKTDGQLTDLRRQIGSRGLDKRELRVRDCLEAVGNGIAMGLLVCGAVEAVNFAVGVHKTAITVQAAE